jgi:hypothetical protein
VALFLPGTTHDYAIRQAGPSILSKEAKTEKEKAEKHYGRAPGARIPDGPLGRRYTSWLP